MADGPKRSPNLRCAIYTRKSSEEGLEQEFNSLQAQREACEAFITSQKGEGWQTLRLITTMGVGRAGHSIGPLCSAFWPRGHVDKNGGFASFLGRAAAAAWNPTRR